MSALKEYGRDWKRIEAAVKTKSVTQVRSHAQKYFLRLQKSGGGGQVPPPRPKRRSVTSTPIIAPPLTTTAPNLVTAAATAHAHAQVACQSPSLLRGAAPNFAKIYAVFARIVDPTATPCTAEWVRAWALSPLDKEIIRLLMRNFEESLGNQDARRSLVASSNLSRPQ